MSMLIAISLCGAAGSGAAAQENLAASREPTNLLSAPSIDIDEDAQGPANPSSLEDLVAAQPAGDDLSPEMRCLAGAIYFESGHESLAGQLAVGRVIVARTRSGRFPTSYCGVVYQHSQFSFIHRKGMPSIDRGSRRWQNSVAIARIADAGSAPSPVEGALFFHAARVSPRWHLQRIAQIDNHIFYR